MSYIGSNLQIGDPTRTSAPLSDVQRFSGNASTTTFTLSRAVNFPTELEVFVENIQQEPIVAFNVSGNTLTFSESPPTGTNNIYVAYRQYVNNQVTLADGSVTYSKLANNIRLFTTDNFIPDGSTTTFTLSEAPADANTLFVMVDGMMQRAPVHYTTSDKTITFTSAPTASSNVHVRHLGFRTTSTITAFPANSSITQLTLQGNTTANGNLNFTGTTPRITGDFSNASAASRLMLQTSTANGVTSVEVIPNGTATQAQYNVANANDPTNTSLGQFSAFSTEIRVTSTARGTGTTLPMTFYTSGFERFRIDTSGNPIFTNAFSKVFSITASVASNILSVSLSSCALDFRSVTATTGTITTVAGTPATLAVPASQSFGISTTTVSNRYAVLCFNNAGTLALGLSPLQGGVQLDETNFLSPTSTVTNTLTTIYSTISASNLAYRVVGFIDIVYVNGTGYSSAPTLVQGYGGQALSAMSSLGYGQTWQDLTASRAIGTTYYNTTGKPIYLYITGAANTTGYFVMQINGVTVATSQQAYTNGTYLTLDIIVPPGVSYSAVVGGNSPSIVRWSELR